MKNSAVQSHCAIELLTILSSTYRVISMSTDPYQNQTSGSGQSQGNTGRCLLIGCVSVVGVLLLMGVCGGFATYWTIQGTLDKYTSTTPAEIPVVQLSEEETDEIKARMETFQTKLDSGETPEPLVLTSKEINGLIASNEKMSGKVYLTIEDGEISGDISIPDFPMKGRYLNGSATFIASLENGVLVVTLDQAEANGEPLPDMVMEGLRNENLAADSYDNPKFAKFLRSMESIEVKHDKIILTPRANSEASNDSPESSEAQPDSVDAEVSEQSDLNIDAAAAENAPPSEQSSTEPAPSSNE